MLEPNLEMQIHQKPLRGTFFDSYSKKLAVLVVTVCVVLFAGLDGQVGLVLFFYLFPLGLGILFGNDTSVMGNALVLIGWGVYLTLAASIVVSKRRAVVIVLFVILLGLLLINVQGCRQMLEHASF